MTREGAMDLHQILLQTWQDGFETHAMLKEAFGDNAPRPNANL
jgi:hypothetical protein